MQILGTSICDFRSFIAYLLQTSEYFLFLCCRQSGYYIDNSLTDTSDKFHVNGQDGVIAGTYDEPSASQPEELKPESTEVTHGNQYPFPPVNPGYALDDTRRLNAAFNETSSQMHNLAQFSNVMVRYLSPCLSTD